MPLKNGAVAPRPAKVLSSARRETVYFLLPVVLTV
jgi:hypothetical protein